MLGTVKPVVDRSRRKVLINAFEVCAALLMGVTAQQVIDKARPEI